MGKRYLAVLMILVMVLSLWPVEALAVDESSTASGADGGENIEQPWADGDVPESTQVPGSETGSSELETPASAEYPNEDRDPTGESIEDVPSSSDAFEEDELTKNPDSLDSNKAGVSLLSSAETYTPYSGANYELTYFENNDGTLTITGYTGTLEGKLVLPENIEGKTVTAIGRVAFSDCKNLQQVTMPSNLEEIGFAAFRNCTGLTGVLTLPDTLVYISEEAFSGCAGLTGTLAIPDAVVGIGEEAFEGCTGVEKLALGRSIEVIGIRAFSSCSNLSGTLSIPETVREIRNMAFQYCTNVQVFILQEGLTSVGYAAFRGCESITTVTFPSSCIRIGEEHLDSYDDYHAGVFAECSNLTNVVFPTTVELLNTYYLFYNCPKLVNPILPNGTVSIDEGAFEGCSSITDLVLPDTLKSIGSQKYNRVADFIGCDNLECVVIPDSVVDLRCSFSDCQKLRNLELPESVEGNFSADGGWIGTYENDEIYLTNCISLERIEIPYGITELPTAMLYNCTSLKEVHIPNSVVKISGNTGSYSPAYGAFEKCTALENITLPNSINTIECGAFSSCTNLKSIIIPDSVINFCKNNWGEYFYLDYDEPGIFEGCVSLETATLPAEIDIICMKMFKDCTSLSSITINEQIQELTKAARQM